MPIFSYYNRDNPTEPVRTFYISQMDATDSGRSLGPPAFSDYQSWTLGTWVAVIVCIAAMLAFVIAMPWALDDFRSDGLLMGVVFGGLFLLFSLCQFSGGSKVQPKEQNRIDNPKKDTNKYGMDTDQQNLIRNTFDRAYKNPEDLKFIQQKVRIPSTLEVRGMNLEKIIEETTKNINQDEFAQWILRGGWKFLNDPKYKSKLSLEDQRELDNFNAISGDSCKLGDYILGQLDIKPLGEGSAEQRTAMREPVSSASVALTAGVITVVVVGLALCIAAAYGANGDIDIGSGLLLAVFLGLFAGICVGIKLRGVRISVPVENREHFEIRLVPAMTALKYQLSGKTANCYEFGNIDSVFFQDTFVISVYLKASSANIVGPAYYAKKLRRKLR